MTQDNEMDSTAYTLDVHRHYRRMATLICALALPLNVLLTVAVFILFPRLTLNAPIPGFQGNRMGYTEQMNLAQKGNLEQNSNVVLWLSFPKPEERSLWNGYLRGDTMSVFNGRDWSADKGRLTRVFAPDSNGIFILASPHSSGPFIHQSITLSDTSAGTLFTIGRPLRVIASLHSLQEYESGGYHWLSSLRRPLHYEVTSEPFFDSQVHAVDLKLPSIPLARIQTLSTQVAGHGSALKRAAAIQEYLQTHYTYSTQFGDRIPDNPVEYFLFDHRQGACGHFASAMALMLRLQHIPSRVVAGYFKGEWNEPAQAVVIRERDAHAWVEAYIPEHGWMSFDPSPRASYGNSVGRTFFHRLAQYNDYFGLLWNRFVIQYDLYSQIKAFEELKGNSDHLGAAMASWWTKNRMRFRRSNMREEAPAETTPASNVSFPWKMAGTVVLLGIAVFFGMARGSSTSYDAAIRFYIRFLDKMARDGHPKWAWETGQDYARRLAVLKPEQAQFAWSITEQYYLARFKKEPL